MYYANSVNESLLKVFLFVSSRPCDIVGDISYEELRAAAYEDAKRGLPMQAIVSQRKPFYPIPEGKSF